MYRTNLYMIFLGVSLSLPLGRPAPAAEPRQVISLNGTWQIADGRMDVAPTRFGRTVPVPGLVSLAMPSFEDPPGPKVADRGRFPQKDPKRDAFWYRRSFPFEGPLPAVASLKVHKAMFGSKVFLNGQTLGEHLPSFTPGDFDARPALKIGENELLIRVGADRDAVGPAVPSGFDFEKERYIPGIFDSVELITSGTPHFTTVQTAPDIASKAVRVQAVVRNEGPPATSTFSFTVREARSGRVAGQLKAAAVVFNKGMETTLDVRIPIAHCRLWSPEDPFLYVLEADSAGDQFRTRFGVREFRFDPATGRAMLNGRPYFMRGSNITLYRFFEDVECKSRPWDADWVRTLHQRVKDMHWNCLRYCIGFPPESWYDVADELGILIQDEFPLWHGGWENWPPALKRDELAREYAEWVRERWNHPSVVVWDASNETLSHETSPAVARVRGLDLSNRPWDNSYMPAQAPGDSFESHPYHFGNPHYRLSDLATADPVPQGNVTPNDGRHAVIINEYGWLWLNRDGTPTTLTRELYANLLGAHAKTSQRRELYARYTAAETEFWRGHRKAAAVMHFTTLGYSRADGQTSDHWLDVGRLEWEPKFVQYVRDAFAPVGLMIDAWAEEYLASENQKIHVVAFNDLDEPWKGTVHFRLLREASPILEESQDIDLPALESKSLNFAVTMPIDKGSYQLEASLLGPGDEPVRSRRDFQIVSEAERKARLGIAVGRPVRASSSLVKDGATAPEAAVDGRPETRWSSEFSDPQWLAVDLGSVVRVSRVELLWDPAFGQRYAIQVSTDGQTWTDVYQTSTGRGGTETVRFKSVEARWVRYAGQTRGTVYGHSLREFRVFP